MTGRNSVPSGEVIVKVQGRGDVRGGGNNPEEETHYPQNWLVMKH